MKIFSQLTGSFEKSFTRCIGDFPRFGRIRIINSLTSEHEYSNFSISTLPMKPEPPVMKIVLPA